MKPEKLSNWQRLEAVIRWANMTVNYFALHIGLPRGENLYQIKKGNNGISRNLADKIVTKFPQISLPWLLTGEGRMFADTDDSGLQVPFHNLDVETRFNDLATLAPDHVFILPPLGDCDLAMVYNGRAMEGSIPSGSIVFLKKVLPEVVIPGMEYVVVSQKIVTLRTLRTSEQPDEWRLVATNRDQFDDLYVNASDVEELYRVCGVLHIKQ